jgi:predicted nucleotidyltransferase
MLIDDDLSPRQIAEPTTILRGLVGSSVHGLVLSGTDDQDEMGVCVEPRRYVVGFGQFEHWVYRSAAEREGHLGARSQAGDLDLTVYSLRKWAHLALQGNPTVLLLLYLPDEAIVLRTAVGEQLQKLSSAFAPGELESDSSDTWKPNDSDWSENADSAISIAWNLCNGSATTRNTPCTCCVSDTKESSF